MLLFSLIALACLRKGRRLDVCELASTIQNKRGHGTCITRGEVVELCRIGPYQATRLLNKLFKVEKLKRFGLRRGVYYELANERK